MFGKFSIEWPLSVFRVRLQELPDPRLLCFEASQDI